MAINANPASENRLSMGDFLKTIAVIFKARIVSLLLASAIGGAFLGAGGFPPLGWLIILVVTGALASGGASAINQYIERDTDSRMRRTDKRPMVNGSVNPTLVLWVSIAMIAIAVLGTLPFKPVMSFYLLLGAVIYVGVYTIWLKPRSVLNIVIGGAAGSCAVMAGGAAVGAATDPGVITLALIVYLWTPAHFWALALFYRDDYAAGNVPMLPVVTSEKQTAWWILIHAVGTGIAALLLAFHPVLGWVYLVPVLLATVVMFASNLRLIHAPERKHAIRFFITTNIFLLVVFVAVIAAVMVNYFLSA